MQHDRKLSPELGPEAAMACRTHQSELELIPTPAKVRVRIILITQKLLTPSAVGWLIGDLLFGAFGRIHAGWAPNAG